MTIPVRLALILFKYASSSSTSSCGIGLIIQQDMGPSREINETILSDTSKPLQRLVLLYQHTLNLKYNRTLNQQ